jgi:two-component sensor histidine kinase
MKRAMDFVPPDRSLVEANLLLCEYSHRINNEFASAIGAISHAAARSGTSEARGALVAVKEQLLNYALVHQALQMPEHSIRIDAAIYLRRLCTAIGRSKLDGRRIELSLVARKCPMNSQRCWRLGLIVSELITNSVRHGLSEAGGAICVELVPASPFIKCRVTDNGTSQPVIRPGRGLEIVAALARSLGGTIDHEFGPHGATSLLVFPAVDEMPSAERKITRVKITRVANMRRRGDREDRERFGRPKGERRRAPDEPVVRNIP